MHSGPPAIRIIGFGVDVSTPEQGEAAISMHSNADGLKLVSDVVEKTSTRHRSRIPCVVVEKITTRFVSSQ